MPLASGYLRIGVVSPPWLHGSFPWGLLKPRQPSHSLMKPGFPGQDGLSVTLKAPPGAVSAESRLRAAGWEPRLVMMGAAGALAVAFQWRGGEWPLQQG